ncbi:Hydroxyethylthiazole kinase [Clostridiaceae bacterium JG1575]|nr:Hydroxyethylthiazole kinase [Clostridiaceae bacterium JG1575]
MDSSLKAPPLIHCITNPISINDVANVILILGMSPMMAEHPKEVAQITKGASALLLNLGNITDVRMEAMRLAAASAKTHEVPLFIDAVGISASTLRLSFLRDLLADHAPVLIKGNYSEMMSLQSGALTTKGVDSAPVDPQAVAQALKELGATHSGFLLATGPLDLLWTGQKVLALQGGHPRMARLTGTGCMLGACLACHYIKEGTQDSLIEGLSLFAQAGSLAAQNSPGQGHFHLAFLDAIDHLSHHPLEVPRHVHPF